MSRFIPIEEVKKLTEGSYEHLISQIEGLVQQHSVKLFGKKTESRVLGTFSTYAVALSEDGDVIRIRYGRNDEGSLQIEGFSSVDIKSYSQANLKEFVSGEVKTAVAEWMEGRVEQAQKRIAAISHLVDGNTMDDSKMVESFIVSLKALRPWKSIYGERKQRIRESAGLRPGQLVEAADAPKFRLLYNGSIVEAKELDRYKDLVVTDLASVATRVGGLLEQVEAAYDNLCSVVRSEDLQDESIRMLSTLSEDLISDLRRLHDVLVAAPSQLSKPDCLGKLHDAVVEELNDYQVAGRFVTTMSTRLREAQ